jgi:starch phosphorylase
MTGWQTVSVEEVMSSDDVEMPVGQEVEVQARVKLGDLMPEDVIVEAYYGRLDHQGEFAERDTVPMEVKDSDGDSYIFRGRIPCRITGHFGCTVRVMPSHKRLENPFAMGLVTWA